MGYQENLRNKESRGWELSATKLPQGEVASKQISERGLVKMTPEHKKNPPW